MMRLGISLQEGYLIILATLIVLQGAGTIYGLCIYKLPSASISKCS